MCLLHWPHFTPTTILPSYTRLVAEDTLIPWVAQTQATGRVTAAVFKVTVTVPVAARPPPARLTLTHTALIAGRQVAAAVEEALQPPVTSVTLTPACELVAGGAHRAPGDAVARLGAGWRPPAIVAGAVPVNLVALGVAGALTGVLAQWTPAIEVASALTCDRVAATVWVALTHLATVRSPKLRRTTWQRIHVTHITEGPHIVSSKQVMIHTFCSSSF